MVFFLSQHKYAQDLVAAAGLQKSTPMELNIKLRKEDDDFLSDPTTYRTLVGSLVYLTITRPDISYAVQQVSRFMASPRHLHMAVVCCIIFYVYGTASHGLFYPTSTSLDLGLLSKLGFPLSNLTPLHVDNTSAIHISANPIFHECTKHIEVDCHFIREAFEGRIISLPHVSTNLEVADIFIKVLTRRRHQFLKKKLMLVDNPHQFEGRGQ